MLNQKLESMFGSTKAVDSCVELAKLYPSLKDRIDLYYEVNQLLGSGTDNREPVPKLTNPHEPLLYAVHIHPINLVSACYFALCRLRTDDKSSDRREKWSALYKKVENAQSILSESLENKKKAIDMLGELDKILSPP